MGSFVIVALIILVVIVLFYYFGNIDFHGLEVILNPEPSYSPIQQLNNYWNVRIGMTENEMLSIMGAGYNRSLLKDGCTVYEWRINAKSVGLFFGGASFREYSGVKKVTIRVKNGYVNEIRPYNV